MKAPSPDLRKLVDQLLDERGMSRLETSQLEDLIRDKEGLRYYAELVSHEAMMADALEGISGIEKPTWVIPFPVKVLLGAAAAVMFFLLGFFARTPGSAKIAEQKSAASIATIAKSDTLITNENNIPARITGMMGVMWADGSEPALLESQGKTRMLSIRTGLVELTYDSGVRVTLEGPVDYAITDATSGKLAAGKLVAYVPKGAEGFHVDYAKGRVVDLGTEFAMDVQRNGKAELGVFDGEVELHLPGQEKRQLLVNQALMHDESAEEIISSIPLDREKFVRRLPSRDFRWEVNASKSKEVEIDVTHLVWKPGNYRALFKWMHGNGGINISNVSLCLNGRPVVESLAQGVTEPKSTSGGGNLISLPLASKDFSRGHWTIRATLTATGTSKNPGKISGIMQFEEGLVTTATEADFIGTWRYNFGGIEHLRQFMPDGTIRFYKARRLATENFVNGHWWVENGVLYQTAPEINVVEEHALRDSNTLIFVNRPYDNATRVPDP